MTHCPYHGPRPTIPDSAGEHQCVACVDSLLGRPVTPMASFTPLAPLITSPTSPAPAHQLEDPVFTISPAQLLLATIPTALLTLDDVLTQIPLHIKAVEAHLGSLPPIGPLVLLYDHPDPADFDHFHFSAAYPIAPDSPPDLIESSATLEFRPLPSLRVASVLFTGPWSMLHLAYPPLRKAIKAAQVPFGRLTFERYIAPFGTNSPHNLTAVQREIAG